MKTIQQRAYEAAFGIGPTIPDSEVAAYAYTVRKDWLEVKCREVSLLRRPQLWVIMPFVLWKTCPAPKSELCTVTDMLGFPSYRYKEFRGKIYLLGPEPGPGFPGA